MTLTDATRNLTHEFCRAISEGDGCLPESDEGVNGASRALIAAMAAEHGRIFLGIVNRYRSSGPQAFLWEYDGSLVRNFGACFVLPTFDAELLRLLESRAVAEYTGTAADSVRIESIFARIEAVGGRLLHWS